MFSSEWPTTFFGFMRHLSHQSSLMLAMAVIAVHVNNFCTSKRSQQQKITFQEKKFSFRIF